MNPDILSPFLRVFRDVIYPESLDSSPRVLILFLLTDTLILLSHRRVSLPSGLFPLGFPTKSHVRVTLLPQVSNVLPKSCSSLSSSCMTPAYIRRIIQHVGPQLDLRIVITLQANDLVIGVQF
jgi:hypothetical protein